MEVEMGCGVLKYITYNHHEYDVVYLRINCKMKQCCISIRTVAENVAIECILNIYSNTSFCRNILMQI